MQFKYLSVVPLNREGNPVHTHSIEALLATSDIEGGWLVVLSVVVGYDCQTELKVYTDRATFLREWRVTAGAV